MKAVEDIRRDNLWLLIEEAGSPARLAVLSEVPAPYISQVSRGVVRSNGRARIMGPDIARKLEAKMGKPRGWMDTDHSALSAVTELNGREGQLIGLFRLLNDAEQSQLVHDLTGRLRRHDNSSPPQLGDDRKRH